MRLSTTLWLSLAIAVPLSVAVAWWPSRTRIAHEVIHEVGALHRFARERPAEARADAAPPIALTASDGTGLSLAALDARAVVVGSLAFTELRLTFDNPLDRTLEGTFRVALPQGASLSRFAMRQGDRWQEGEVVETQRARQVYEDFLHRRQDPALLEKAAGNEFSARVFPIPARGRKELIVSYAQPITPEVPYTLPLRGLPAVGQLDAVVTRQGDDAPILAQVHSTGAAPERDLVVEASRLPPGQGVRAGELAMVRVRPEASAGADPVGSAIVLVDTSASRALGFEAQLALVARLADGLGPAALTVAAFDQGIDVVYQGPASGFAAAGVTSLRERQAFGASNLERALGWAGERARGGQTRRVVLVTDGIPTMGAVEPGPLQRAARALGEAGVERLDAVTVGGIRDDALLEGLCRAGLARDGVVIDGSRGAEAAVRRLQLVTRRLEVKVEGATWQWPATLEGVQPGDEALVYASLPPGAPARLTVNGATTDLALAEVERPLLERAWVGAKINQLVQHPPSGKTADAVRDEIVQLSTRFRVLSPHTSLLVLETENDYARYKIDRQALADILTIEGTRLTLARRAAGSAAPVVDPTTSPPPTRNQSDGVVLRAPPAPPPAADGERPSGAKGGGGSARGAGASPAAAALEQAISETLAAREEGAARPRAAAAVAAAPPPAEAPAPAKPSPRPAATAAPPGAGAGRAAPDELDSLEVRGGGAAATAGGGLRLGATGGGAGGASKSRPGLAGLSGKMEADKKASGDSGEPASMRADVTGTAAVAEGSLAGAERVMASLRPRLRACYRAGLLGDPTMAGRLSVLVAVGADGRPTGLSATTSGSLSPAVLACARATFRQAPFEPPRGGPAQVRGSLTFASGDRPRAFPEPAAPPAPAPFEAPAAPSAAVDPAPSARLGQAGRTAAPTTFGPYEGELAGVMEALSRRDSQAALTRAVAFHDRDPGDVLGLLALGEVFEATGETRSAARAYGSIIDLFSSRADLRRMAGGRLERLEPAYAHALAADSFARAAQQRPDHPSSHRMLAYARLRAGDPKGAFEAIEAGVNRRYPEGRFLGVDRILREDMGLIGAAWIRASGSARAEVEQRLGRAGARLEDGPSLRFVLTWETDANDVDFHIHDAVGGHAYYSHKTLPSGGELYADVTTGYGPECFTVRKPPSERTSYRLEAHYYSRGPMGYGMGTLEVIDHDGDGHLTFEERPFVIMQDRAYVQLGSYPASKAGAAAPGPSGDPSLLPPPR